MRTLLLTGLTGLAVAASAQTNAPTVRAVTLAECVSLALQRNLDIQVRRLQPTIDLYNAEAARGAYDLTFNLNSAWRFNASPGSADPAYWPIVQAARASLSTYADLEELIRLGAYKIGSNPEVDRAIKLFPELENFLRQSKEESTSLSDSYARLASVMASM